MASNQKLLPPTAKTAPKRRGHRPDGRFTTGNTGGKKGRSGRKPYHFLHAAQVAAERAKVPDFWARVAAGTEMECRGPDEAGVLVYAPPRMADRLKASQLLYSYAAGLPTQTVEVSGELKQYVIEAPAKPLTAADWRAAFAGKN